MKEFSEHLFKDISTWLEELAFLATKSDNIDELPNIELLLSNGFKKGLKIYFNNLHKNKLCNLFF